MTQLGTKFLWLFVATLGAICFGYLALKMVKVYQRFIWWLLLYVFI